jgi:dihydroflavonol-4-reductase
MERVLVTGATGLIGANVCAQVAESGDVPRALVRPGSQTLELEALGAEIAFGDITSAEAVRAAADGCRYCVHTAALVVGGPAHPLEYYRAVNVKGAANVLDAARTAGVKRTVMYQSSAALDTTGTLKDTDWTFTDAKDGDPYSITKREAWELTLRAVDAGLDAVLLLPGATFGPAPTLGRALVPPGFNSRLVLALAGELDTFPASPLSFVLAEDVARSSLVALERGRPGEAYFAWSAPDDVIDAVTFFNIGLERAGREHRVTALTQADLARPEVLERWGPAILRTARPLEGPLFDNPLTRERLGHDPLPARRAVEVTVDWLLEHRLAPDHDPE